MDDRQAELLPVPYFHVVFTLPNCIAAVALQNPRVTYDILFHAAAKALRRIAADPRHLGADIGLLAVLHTWGQQLNHHPHVHCVVPGGGLSPDGSRWVPARPNFFLSVKVLSEVYRGVFLRDLGAAFAEGKLQFNGRLKSWATPQGFASCIAEACEKDWNVYAKPPFGGPEQVLDYLGRYTHRVAISNHRLVDVDEGRVAFRWRDYNRGNKTDIMTLDANEFIRRFLMHTLPKGFVRLRYYGWMANRHRTGKLEQCRTLLSAPPSPRQRLRDLHWRNRLMLLTGYPIDMCPRCREGRLIPTAQALSNPQEPPTMDSS